MDVDDLKETKYKSGADGSMSSSASSSSKSDNQTSNKEANGKEKTEPALVIEVENEEPRMTLRKRSYNEEDGTRRNLRSSSNNLKEAESSKKAGAPVVKKRKKRDTDYNDSDTEFEAMLEDGKEQERKKIS